MKVKIETNKVPGTDIDSGPASPAATNATIQEGPNSSRFRTFVFFLVAISLVFLDPLIRLFFVARRSEVHSYILLIPFIFAYLIHIRRHQVPVNSQRSILEGATLSAVGLVALAFGFGSPEFSVQVNPSDHLSLIIFAFVCFVVSGGFLLLGKGWMRAWMFPFAFLIFLVPLPTEAVDWLERASQVASADAADLLFTLSGTPILRDGMVFQLPGMVIEVAQECSGIRSSLVLFITSLVAAHLFLNATWARIVLVAFVIPLGILRNGFRIMVIGLLCVHYGPGMINSIIHRRGGPLFFALSLVPLFLLLLWLRKVDTKERNGCPTSLDDSEASRSV
jgi:exosortase C (VPDSG-CTERM-specific)